MVRDCRVHEQQVVVLVRDDEHLPGQVDGIGGHGIGGGCRIGGVSGIGRISWVGRIGGVCGICWISWVGRVHGIARVFGGGAVHAEGNHLSDQRRIVGPVRFSDQQVGAWPGVGHGSVRLGQQHAVLLDPHGAVFVDAGTPCGGFALHDGALGDDAVDRAALMQLQHHVRGVLDLRQQDVVAVRPVAEIEDPLPVAALYVVKPHRGRDGKGAVDLADVVGGRRVGGVRWISRIGWVCRVRGIDRICRVSRIGWLVRRQGAVRGHGQPEDHPVQIVGDGDRLQNDRRNLCRHLAQPHAILSQPQRAVRIQTRGKGSRLFRNQRAGGGDGVAGLSDRQLQDQPVGRAILRQHERRAAVRRAVGHNPLVRPYGDVIDASGQVDPERPGKRAVVVVRGRQPVVAGLHHVDAHDRADQVVIVRPVRLPDVFVDPGHIGGHDGLYLVLQHAVLLDPHAAVGVYADAPRCHFSGHDGVRRDDPVDDAVLVEGEHHVGGVFHLREDDVAVLRAAPEIEDPLPVGTLYLVEAGSHLERKGARDIVDVENCIG